MHARTSGFRALGGRRARGHRWPGLKELDRRRQVYAGLLGQALDASRRGNVDESLVCAYAAAQVAYLHHFGLWVDPQLGDLARQLGSRIDGIPTKTTTHTDHEHRVVHVASVLTDSGGHTAIIRHWIKAIKSLGFEQSLISAELQDARSIGTSTLAFAESSDVNTALCPRGISASERVRWLARQICATDVGTLILYIDPADVFVITALEIVRRHKDVRVWFYNHCDHTFSVGWNLADRVIHSRAETVGHSVHYRGMPLSHAVYVPLTVEVGSQAAFDRINYGIPTGATVSVTAANFHKLIPDDGWHFGELLGDLLEAEPTHHHLMIGNGLWRNRRHLELPLARRSRSVRSRVHWLGRQPDLTRVFRSADFMLDTAPLSGATTRLEAMATGLPIVATYLTANPLLSRCGGLPDDYPLRAQSQADALRMARRLVRDPALRTQLGQTLRRHYATKFTPETLRARLATLLREDHPPAMPVASMDDYDLGHLASLSGPVPGPDVLLRRARVWLDLPQTRTRDRALRTVDRLFAGVRIIGGG